MLSCSISDALTVTDIYVYCYTDWTDGDFPNDHGINFDIRFKTPNQTWEEVEAATGGTDIRFFKQDDNALQIATPVPRGAGSFEAKFRHSIPMVFPNPGGWTPWSTVAKYVQAFTGNVNVDVANIALGHLGTTSIQSVDENSPEALHVNRQWSLARDALLRQRHWNFAIKRVELDLAGLVELAAGVTTRGDATVMVTSTAALTVGQTLIGDGIPASAKVESITNGTTFEMDTDATATGSALEITAYDAPAFDYQYAYRLPGDYLRALNWNGREAGTSEAGYDIESGLLLTDDACAQLRYVAKITDVTKWDDSFKEAFCLRLAARVATGITTAQGLASQLDQRAEQYLQKAFGPDNGETKPRAVLAQNASGWLDARNGLDSRFG